MDFFDERVLAALKDGKPRSFKALLSEVGFSHNTLQQHLTQLVARDLVVKDKMVSSSLGRPKFTYHVPSIATKQVTPTLQNPHDALVIMQFSRLRHLCRFEKGGYCKEARKNCEPSNCPKSENMNHNHFTSISRQASARPRCDNKAALGDENNNANCIRCYMC